MERRAYAVAEAGCNCLMDSDVAGMIGARRYEWSGDHANRNGSFKSMHSAIAFSAWW
jgi:hypothetical protein